MTPGKTKAYVQWRPSDGHDGAHLDRYTLLQFGVGLLGGYLRLPWWIALAGAVAWEAFEYEMRRRSPGAHAQVSRAVWPVWTYPTSTSDWTQEEFFQWDNRFRPAGYMGGIYDQAAWAAHNAPPSASQQILNTFLPIAGLAAALLVGRWLWKR
jgi:hypothetical protein